MRGRKVLLSLSSPRLFMGADTVEKRFDQICSRADSDAEISVRYERLSYRGYAAARPISSIWPSFKAHEGAFNCHIQNNTKRRVSNPLWKAYSSYFSEQLFCSVSLFTSSGACHYGWPALCQWFAAPVPAAPAESPLPASPGTYSGNSRSRWQFYPGRRRR